MKYFLLICFPICLFAQKGETNYYQQNAVIQAPLYDCYNRNLDAGNAARDKGDCSTAVKYYQEALNCTDVQNNNRRIADLEILIRQCENEPVQAAEKTANERPPLTVGTTSSRRYLPSATFLRYAGDSCFSITRKEADRAYAQRCWDDAAKLYRAAKSCADANQSERRSMNEAITRCRNSAEDELRFREQEAIRLARHAIADNLAGDAQKVLSQFDRTLAYRLADFANEYIAPDDNPKCIQALLDAWYYKPTVENRALQVPFCYQLAGNLPATTLVCPLGKGKNGKIYAYAPQQTILWSWNAQTFEPLEPVTLHESYNTFAASPDGKTLIFFADKSVLIWRSATQFIKVPIKTIAAWAFNPTGDILYYFDPSEAGIFSISLQDLFGPKRGSNKKITPELFFAVPNLEFTSFEVTGNTLWLGFWERLEIWQRKPADKTWAMEKSITFDQRPGFFQKVSMFPATQTIVLLGDTSFVYNIAAAGGANSNLSPALTINGQMLCVGSGAKLAARMLPSSDALPDRLLVFSLTDGNTQFGAFTHLGEWAEFPLGAFTPDNHWLFAVSLNGALYAWDLSERQSDWLSGVETAENIVMSSDGARLVVQTKTQLEVRNIDHQGKAQVLLQNVAPDAELLGVSNDWVAFRREKDQLCFISLSGKPQQDCTIAPSTNDEIAVAFSDDDRQVALADGSNTVTIRSLESGAVLASKTFDESIRALHFIPQTTQLIVLLQTSQSLGQNARTTAKLWDYAAATPRQRVVRLHNYTIQMMCVSQLGDLMAFSDGHDVRIFSVYNMLDELARINRNKDMEITSIAFEEDGATIATGYKDGTIDIWDIQKGEVLFKLQAVNQLGDCWVKSMAFLSNGKQIRQVNNNFTVATRDLDPVTIRSQAQTVYRRLLPFTPDQIREYGLEDALNYMGNFERLAESGEWPLIRAFFEFYSLQARRSNNIQRVDEYCQRALRLYQQLDAATQASLRATMLEMLRDFNWKCLLRNKIPAAENVVALMNESFDHPPEAKEAAAYAALLKGDIRNATSLFTDWAYWSHHSRYIAFENNWSALDTLQLKVHQLAEYDLLDEPQRTCICGMFGGLIDLKNICPSGNSKIAASAFDPSQQLRWNILRNRHQSILVLDFAKKDKLLQQAYADARALQRFNLPDGRQILHETALNLAENYYNWGVFEVQSPLGTEYFKKSIALLEDMKHPTSPPIDSAQLGVLAKNYLSIGNQLLAKNQLNEAAAAFENGIGMVNLWTKATRDTFYQNESAANLAFSLNTQLGLTRLYLGKTVAAKQAFEATERIQLYNPPVYAGLVPLMQGDETSAFVDFGSLNDESAVAKVLVTIEELAQRFPEKRASLDSFEIRLKSAVLNVKLLDTNMLDYWYAAEHFQKYVNLKQWDNVLSWSQSALKAASRAMTGPASYGVKDYWLNEHINQAYYLILSHWQDPATLSKSIEYSEKAQAYVSQSYPGYFNKELIKTNLGHAYWLRNQPGDREKSIQIYRSFLTAEPNDGNDHWALLLKDFRDLQRLGVQFPQMEQLLDAIRPYGTE
jgi:WD40 repeat protein